MGFLDDLKFDDNLCELWIGPTGDEIYHFHKEYPVEPDIPATAGMPPHLENQDIDNGFVFLFVASNNPVWYPVIRNSFMNNFTGASLYRGRCPAKFDNIFDQMPAYLNPLHKKLIDSVGKTHTVQATMSVYTGHRFLVKMALGLGSIFLNKTFMWSDEADLLRNFIWTKNNKIRDTIPLHGSTFLNSEVMPELDEMLRWRGGHVVGLMNMGNILVQYANFYGIGGSIIGVSTDRNHWEGKIEHGRFYVIIPGMQRYVGPITLLDLAMHKSYGYSQLALLEERIKNTPPLPPYFISQKIN